MRHFSWKLAIVFLLGFGIIAGTVAGLHYLQKSGRYKEYKEQGENSFDLGQWQEAATLLGKCIPYIPKDEPKTKIKMLHKYAEAQLKIKPLETGNFQQAISSFRGILRIDAGDRSAARQLTEIYLQRGAVGEARRVAQRFLEGRRDAHVECLLAEALIFQGEFDEAHTRLEAVIENEPNQIMAYQRLAGITKERPDDYDVPAIHWLDLAISLADSDLPVDDISRRILEAVSSERPKNTLVTDYEISDRLKELGRKIERIRNNPESPSAYLARARFNLFDQEKALVERKALVALDLETALTKTFSDDPEEHMAMAWLCRAMEQSDRVQEQLDAIQELQPDHLGMWIFRAGVALESQDKDSKEKMRQVADESQANLNDNKLSFYGLATELYVRAEAFDQATACLKALVEQNDRPEEVAFLEGLLAFQQHHVQEAVLKWQRALALGYTGASRSIQYYLGFKPVSLKFLLASAQTELGDTLSSRQLIESLASDNKDDIFVQVLLARHMAGIGDWAQAKVYIQRVLNMDPNNRGAAKLNLKADVMNLVREDNVSPDQWQGVQQRIEDFEKLEPLEGSDEDTTFIPLLKFQIAFDCNDLKMAEQILAQLAPTDPNDQQKVIVARVNLLSAQNKTDEIVVLLRTAVEQHDQSVSMVSLLCHFLLKAGEEEAVERVLKDAMSRMEGPQSHLRLGYMLSDLLASWAARQEKDQSLRDGLYKENETLLQTLDPNTIMVQRRLLQCKSVTDEPGQAQTLINKIRSLEGEEGWQWRYEQAKLWFVQSDRSKYSEGMSLLQQNLRRNSNDQQSRQLLAAIYSKAGESSLALATYRDALKREPDNLSIVIPAVRALQDAREVDEAQAILRRVAKKDLTGSAGPALDILQVQSYLQQGQVNSAATLMESCLKDDPNNIGIAMALAKLKASEKEYVVAKAMISSIRENTHVNSETFELDKLEVQILMQQELSDQALERCNDLVATFKDPNSLTLRSDVRASLGQIEDAIEDLDQAIKYSQDNADLWVKKSRLFWLLKQKAETRDAADEARQQKKNALDAMDKAILLAPTDPNVVVQATSLFMATQEPDRVATAKALLEEASHQDSDDYLYKVQKIRFMLMDADAVSQIQAEALLEQLTIEYPKKAFGWLMLGNLLMRLENWVEAQNVAIRGLTNLKGNLSLLDLKARAEIRISPSFAVQTLEAMLEQAPGHAVIVLTLADAHIRAERPEKAIQVLSTYKALFTREVDANEVDVKVYEYTLLSALLDAEKEVEATALLAELQEKYPDDESTIMVQIQHWIKKGNLDAVEQEVMQWLEVNSEKTAPVEYTSRELLRLGSAEAVKVASRLLTSALEKQPESESLLMSLADTLLSQKGVKQAAELYKQAAELYKRVLRVNSSNVKAMNNLAWIYGHDLGQMEKALQWARKGLALTPQYNDLLDTYGTLCYKAGQYDEAIKNLKECLNRPSYQHANSAAATMYTLAKSYQAVGYKTDARLMFRQCLDRNRQLKTNGIIGLTDQQKRDAEDQQVAVIGN